MMIFMKRFLPVISAIWLLEACQQDLDTYSGENFAYFDGLQDSAYASFAYIETEQLTDTVLLWIKASGQVAGFDRRITMKVAETNGVENTDFMTLPEYYTLPAKSTICVASVILMRTEALKREERYLILELQENEDFKLMLPLENKKNSREQYSKIHYKILFSEIMVAPKRWNNAYFATFSVKKLSVMCEKMKITRDKFNDANYMLLSRQRYIAKKMKQIFEDCKANGETIYEDDNVTEMTMGASV